MSDIIKELCAPHFWAIIVTAAVVIFLVAGGQGLKPLVMALIKRLSGEHVEVNVINEGGEVMAGKSQKAECQACGLLVDPTKCILHQSEHERSLRNEEQIKELWVNFGKMRDEMNAGFKETRQTILSGQSAILKAIGQKPTDWKGTKNGGGGGFLE